MMDDLVDRIYEAAFLPELWPGVLQSLSDVSNSAAGSFSLMMDGVAARFVATDLMRPVFEEIESKREWKHSDVVQMLFSLPPPAAFIYDADYFPPDVLAANHVRTDRTRPLGIGGEVGSFIRIPTGEVILFAMERWLDNDRPSREELAVLNRMRPHLARAGLIGARLRLERAQAMTSTLQQLGLPAAVMTAMGHVLATNPLLEASPDLFIPTARDGIAIADPNANGLLQAAIGVLSRGAASEVSSIAVAAREDRSACVVHVLPLCGSSRDIFGRGDILIAATPIQQDQTAPSDSLLAALFDLSPAEAKLAAALSSGAPLKDAALASGITIKSARTYLDRIFSKTGTHRQTELLSLLRNAQPLGKGAP